MLASDPRGAEEGDEEPWIRMFTASRWGKPPSARSSRRSPMPLPGPTTSDQRSTSIANSAAVPIPRTGRSVGSGPASDTGSVPEGSTSRASERTEGPAG